MRLVRLNSGLIDGDPLDAAMPAPIPVIVNAAGGAASRAGPALAADITAAFAAAGARVAVNLAAPADIDAAIQAAAADHSRIVIGGGDGTIGSAAAVLRGTATQLAILPLGTLNHFALDLGIPADLPAAAALAASGTARPVDLGLIGDTVFVNNVSVGLYPLFVERRGGWQARGLAKWAAALPAAWSVLKRLPQWRLSLSIDGAARRISTPLLFIGNNLYSRDAGTVGRRERLSDGQLSLFALRPRQRRALVGFAVRALRGASNDADFVELALARTVELRSLRARMLIAHDGETSYFATPVKIAIDPGALLVVASDAAE